MNEALILKIRQYIGAQQQVGYFAAEHSIRLLRQCLQQGYDELSPWLKFAEGKNQSWCENNLVLLSRPEFWLLAQELAGRSVTVADWHKTASALQVTEDQSVLWLEDVLLAAGIPLAQLVASQQQVSFLGLYQLGRFSQACLDETCQHHQQQLDSLVPDSLQQPFPQLFQYGLQKVQRDADAKQTEFQHQSQYLAQLQEDVENLFTEKQQCKNSLHVEAELRVDAENKIAQLSQQQTELQQLLQKSKNEQVQLTAQIDALQRNLTEQYNALSQQLATQKQLYLQVQHQLKQQVKLVAEAQGETAQLRANMVTQHQDAQQKQRQIVQQLQQSEQLCAAQQLHITSLKHHAKKLQRSLAFRWASKLKRISGGNRLEQRLLKQSAQLLNSSTLFDAQWYCQQYPDVAATRLEPAVHYLQFGANEGRQPSAQFNGNAYLARYPDIASSGQNPLLHYLQYGRLEGRQYD